MDERVQTLVGPFVGQAIPILGPATSAVVYGSAARGDWDPDWSDINLLLVAERVGRAELRALGPLLAALPPAWRTPPFLFQREEWARAGDAFPIELADMHQAHVVVYGPDPVAGFHPDPGHLRGAMERELRAKLLHLRQGYALRAGDPAGLGELVRHTLGPVLVLARVGLALLGRPVPAGGVDTLRQFAAATGGPPDVLAELASHRREGQWACPPGMFEGYLESIAAAAAFIDHHQPGVA